MEKNSGLTLVVKQIHVPWHDSHEHGCQLLQSVRSQPYESFACEPRRCVLLNEFSLVHGTYSFHMRHYLFILLYSNEGICLINITQSSYKRKQGMTNLISLVNQKGNATTKQYYISKKWLNFFKLTSIPTERQISSPTRHLSLILSSVSCRSLTAGSHRSRK